MNITSNLFEFFFYLFQLLLSQDVYGYGYNSVARLIEKLHLKKNPPSPIENSPLTPVTLENVEAFAKNWEKWLAK